ncbi:hypothetical protein D3C72_2526460 [compost metagenome]
MTGLTAHNGIGLCQVVAARKLRLATTSGRMDTGFEGLAADAALKLSRKGGCWTSV